MKREEELNPLSEDGKAALCDTVPSLPSQLKTLILEIVELDIKLYPDQLTRCPTTVEAFVKGVRNLVGGGRILGFRDDVGSCVVFVSFLAPFFSSFIHRLTRTHAPSPTKTNPPPANQINSTRTARLPVSRLHIHSRSLGVI